MPQTRQRHRRLRQGAQPFRHQRQRGGSGQTVEITQPEQHDRVRRHPEHHVLDRRFHLTALPGALPPRGDRQVEREGPQLQRHHQRQDIHAARHQHETQGAHSPAGTNTPRGCPPAHPSARPPSASTSTISTPINISFKALREAVHPVRTVEDRFTSSGHASTAATPGQPRSPGQPPTRRGPCPCVPRHSDETVPSAPAAGPVREGKLGKGLMVVAFSRHQGHRGHRAGPGPGCGPRSVCIRFTTGPGCSPIQTTSTNNGTGSPISRHPQIPTSRRGPGSSCRRRPRLEHAEIVRRRGHHAGHRADHQDLRNRKSPRHHQEFAR
jgi:hypothetical protein